MTIALGTAWLTVAADKSAHRQSPAHAPDRAANALTSPDTSQPAAISTDLLDLAAHIRQVVDPPDPGSRYTHIHIRKWIPDRPGERSMAVRVEDNRFWWAANGAARRLTRLLDPITGNPSAPTEERFPPGGYEPAIETPSTLPFQLAGQLAKHWPLQSGPHELIAAVADLCKEYALNPAQRAAVLHLLANTTGIVTCGTGTDRLNRSGLTVCADAPDGTRSLALIDRSSGKLLRYHLLVPTTPSAAVPDQQFEVLEEILYLESHRTDRTD